MALDERALVTAAQVFDELDVEDDAGTHRARVERYITAASLTAARIIDRPLHYNPVVVERVAGSGGVRLLLGRTPIVSIASVVIDGETADVADLIVESATAGIVYREAGWPWMPQLQPGPSYHPLPGSEEPAIVLTYAGGWVTPTQATVQLPVTVPEDLADAVIELVTSRWRRRGNDLRVVSSNNTASSRTVPDAMKRSTRWASGWRTSMPSGVGAAPMPTASRSIPWPGCPATSPFPPRPS